MIKIHRRSPEGSPVLPPESSCAPVGTAKMNDVAPQAWLADVLARIADHPAHKLLPWNWAGSIRVDRAA